jgi:hypothetical protein
MAKPRVGMDKLDTPKAAAVAVQHATGQRVTHQQVMVNALRDVLGRRVAA